MFAEMRAQFFFFYEATRMASPQATLTGRQIKDAAKAADMITELDHELVLEGQGYDADQVIADATLVDLGCSDAEQPKRFFLRPPIGAGRP